MMRLRTGHHLLIFANVFAALLYSPNFVSIVLPGVRLFQLAVFVLTAMYLVCRPRHCLDAITGLLLCFVACVICSALLNYPRFENPESLYLALSYALKALSIVVLFQLVRSPEDFDAMLKYAVAVLLGYALHGIVQFVAVAAGLNAQRGAIEFAGYDFIDLGWLGIYRVALTLGDVTLVRIQSFFQEPGFFAFYLVLALVLADCARDRGCWRDTRYTILILVLATLLTMSLTGIVLMFAYLTLRTRSILVRLTAIAVAVAAVDFVVFNESEFISKAGSFEMRLEHLSLLTTLARSWPNWLLGIGMGNDALLSDMRVNNFLAELVMYASPVGFVVAGLAIATSMRRGRKSHHIMLMALAFALSTPMIWSPMFLLALYVSYRMSAFPRSAPLRVSYSTKIPDDGQR